MAFQILTETPSALYAVTQSTTPELHVWKSTDSGATWTEQDTANNPSVTNANYPFDACDTRSGPYIGTARFTATNTIRAALFDMSTDLWGTDLGAADVDVNDSNERSIRISIDNSFNTAAPGSQVVHFVGSTDDADLRYSRRTTSTWSASSLLLSLTSTESSLVSDVVVDKSPVGFLQRFYYDIVNFDFSLRSLTATTQGTEVDVDGSAADVETEHASAVYQIYQSSNVDKIVVAYIDADGSIQERTATLEVTSASVTLGTEHAVGTATTSAGRQLSSCEYDGDLYIAANVSGTGITYYIDAGATGTWDSGTSHVSGLTGCTLSQAISIPGVGLAVVYTDNGDAKIDWIAGGPAGGAVSKSDSDSLDLTLTEVDSVLNAAPETESLVVTATESEIVTRLNQRADSDPLTVTLTEIDSVAATILESDALAVTITESEVVSKLIQKADNDSLSVTLTEVDAVASAIADADSLAITLTESETVSRLNQRADTDPLAVTASENESVAVSILESDSLAVTITESEVVTRLLQKADTDSLAVTLAETESLLGKPADTDSIAVTLSESEAVSRINQRADSDTLAITLAETDVVAAQIADTDSISITLTEVEDITGDITQKTDSDSLSVTSSEVESITAQVADSDPLAITLTESELVSRINQRADSDTLSITLAESESVTAAIAETDSLAITVTESESVAKQSFKVDSDTLAITIVDTESVSVAIVDTDEIVNLTESELVTAQITDLDSLANCGYGMEPYGDCGYGGESFLTESEIVSGYILGKNDSDTLDLTLTESESVYVVPRGTLDADLQIEQVLTGDLSITSPFFGVVRVERPSGELKGKVSVQSPMQSRMMVDKERTAEVLYGDLVVT
jgi:epidermal growth factor receptor substrate 15